MDFFKSVFSDDPLPPGSDPGSPKQPERHDPPGDAPAPGTGSGGDAWSFGGLIKNLATRSESVIQHYRRDIEEFGSGLRKETKLIREAASQAVKDLPASLEVGASVAQESLESVGQAIDDLSATVWKSTTEIISHSKDSLLDLDSDSADNANAGGNISGGSQLHSYSSPGLDVKKYSRCDAQLRAIQCDVGTYCDEPEDKEDYGEWKLGFVLEDRNAEIESLIQENGIIKDMYDRVVPDMVDGEIFWGRYFYRVDKLKQAEDARARLVKRAISGDEDEDLRWDFDDDVNGEEDEGSASNSKLGILESAKEGSSQVAGEEKDQGSGFETKSSGGADEEVSEEPRDGKSDGKIEEKEKVESTESCKDSDVSIVSTQPSIPEEDLGWDEIEDMVSNDESRGDGGASSSASRVDLRKRLSAAEEEEDLSWDIEEDDEPPKAQ